LYAAATEEGSEWPTIWTGVNAVPVPRVVVKPTSTSAGTSVAVTEANEIRTRFKAMESLADPRHAMTVLAVAATVATATEAVAEAPERTT